MTNNDDFMMTLIKKTLLPRNMDLKDTNMYDDVIKWKHFPRFWPFVWGIHRSPVNSPHKGQWRGALIFSLISFWINGLVNNRGAGDLGRYRTPCDVTVMCKTHRNRKIPYMKRHRWTKGFEGRPCVSPISFMQTRHIDRVHGWIITCHCFTMT